MTLLSICQDAADELGLDNRPVSIIGNVDVDALRLLRFTSRVCRDLATRAPWQSLRLVQTFTATATEVQALAIPAGFQRFSPETVWDLTTSVSVTGPIDPTEYQSRKQNMSAAGYVGPMRWFTRRGNDFLVWPIPVGGEIYQYEYQSAAFCQSASGTAQTAWLDDTDTCRLSEELVTLGVVAMFLSADGQPAQVAQGAYERRVMTEIKNDAPTAHILPAGDIFGTGRRSTGEPGGGNGLGGAGGGGGWVWG